MNPTFKSYLAITFIMIFCNQCRNTPPQSRYLAGIRQTQTTIDPKAPAPAIHDDVSYWEGDDVTGRPWIKINRQEQRAYFYKDEKLVGVSLISSGKEDTGTPAGHYKITQKSKNHKSSAYGVFKDKATGQTIDDNVDIREKTPPPGAYFVAAPMWNFMRFNAGIGMHTGYLPGYAASHGCVRMPHQMSTKFFEHAEIGTPVIVE